jgi:tetratricopeptide (TPR) repeat protein
MAMAYGKTRFTLTMLLLLSVSVTGCVAVMPGKQPVKGEGFTGAMGGNGGHAMRSGANAPLPKQSYDANGNKVPYVPQANPYTSRSASIPMEARSRFIVASGLLRQGNLKDAREQLLGLTEKYPSLSGPWVKLGNIAEQNGKYDEAITHYKKAVSVNRNNVNAYIALGLAQRRQGYFADAQQTYIAALNIWRDFPEAHLNLAILYDLYADKAEEAQKHYEAYEFLTRDKDAKVHKWVVEVRRRSGIEGSFIDNPPKGIAEVPVRETDDTGAEANAGGTG